MEECNAALIAAKNNQRSKKIEQLLSKVKSVTQKEKKVKGVVEPLAITAGLPIVSIKAAPSKPNDTFLTFIPNNISKNDEELTDEALLRQYDELIMNDANFGHNKKKKKGAYPDLADELLEDLDQHERDMNDMLNYISEVEEVIHNGQDL